MNAERPLDPATASLPALCRHLLALTQAQTAALEADDFTAFARLAAVRATATAVLERWPAGAASGEAAALLREAAALDQQNLARVRAWLAEAARDLQVVRRGQAALRGYSRPGAHLLTMAALDQTC
jgi:hypothetical protein